MSSVLITLAVTSSPTLNKSDRVWPSSNDTSFEVRMPSFLQPMFIMISFSFTWSTLPVMIAPVLGRANEASISSMISAIEMFSLVMFSLIVEITSLITRSGVDAPAAIPIVLYFSNSFNGKSPISSIKKQLFCFFLQISYNFCVLEEFLPPITIIASTFSAKSAADF